MTVTSNITTTESAYKFLSLLFELFHKFIFRVKVSKPAMSPNLATAPIQSDSLAINFEFDIRHKEVRPSIRRFLLCSLVNCFSGKLVKIGATRCQI